jgi:AraC-like DNA-binding protein
MNTEVQFNSGTGYNLSILGEQPSPSFEVRNIVRFLDDSPSHSSDGLMAHLQIDKTQLEEPCLPAYKILEAFQYCSHKLEPLAGAQIGTLYKVKDLDTFGYAICSCLTLEQALSMGDKYDSVLGHLVKRSAQIEGEALVSKLTNVQEIDAQALSFFVTLGISARLHMARSIFGKDLAYSSVSFTFNDEANRQYYEDLFGCPVQFSQESNSWSLNTSDLARPGPQEAQIRVVQDLPYSEALLGKLGAKDPLVTEVQQILIRSGGAYPDIEILSNVFKISSRTLRRQLSKLDTSYQRILNQVRRELSIDYLTQTMISIDDISTLIGFSDVTNFRHAFKKWVGKTPSFYRKSKQNQ